MSALAQPLILFIDVLGRKWILFLRTLLRLLQTTYLAGRTAFFDQSQGLRTILSVISAQVYFTGWQALPLISLLSLAVGSIIIMQSTAQLSLFGNMDLLGRLLVVIVVRELGPLVTALVVIARSGTAVATELGNMRVNREIEALMSMGIHPLSFIVFPRLIGGLISVLCLAFYFNVIAILGGFLLSSLINNLSFSVFTDSLAQAFSGLDVILFFVKNGFSGLIIFLVSCDHGISVARSPHEVPQATTRAVMDAIFYVVSFNLLVTAFVYFKELAQLGVI